MTTRSRVAIDTVSSPESVATDTVPLPEFRFETALLDQLLETGRLDAHTDLKIRFRLNLDAIRTAEHVGYFNEAPADSQSPDPPDWCLTATGVSPQINLLLVECLIANKILDAKAQVLLEGAARDYGLVEMAPTLFRQIERANNSWSAERALEVLDRAFQAVSGAAYPAVEGELDRYCRQRPDDPLSLAAHVTLATSPGRRLVQTLLIAAALQQDGLLTDPQYRYMLNSSYHTLAAPGVIKDLNLSRAGIIVDGLKLDTVNRARLLSTLAGSRLGYVDPDGPWSDLCTGRDQPEYCRYVRRFPVAATFFGQLVKQNMATEDSMTTIWERFANLMGIMVPRA